MWGKLLAVEVEGKDRKLDGLLLTWDLEAATMLVVAAAMGLNDWGDMESDSRLAAVDGCDEAETS